MTRDVAAAATKAMKIAARIKPMLKGKGPEMQGAVLAELVATWLAGHHPALRDVTLSMWLDTVKDLVSPCEDEIFGGGPRPEGWV
jgi:hypothetical protein